MSNLSWSTGAESESQNDSRPKLAHVPLESPSEPVTSDTTRREYALLELLRSERTYASDLVLLRDYQIPLASGRLSSMSSIWPAVEDTVCQYLGLRPAASDASPAIPSGPSTVASRRLTTTSTISAVSLGSIFTLRPMKTKDINVVFSNIENLAAFSEEFLDQLESALGELIEDNEGEDYVGRLFLDFIPQMESLYKTYIMNQPRALEHYHRLSKTFQFDMYFPQSQILAHKSSNAWDLPSLLIKPVQRLLHYPQLLAAIAAETPDFHGDKANLVEACVRMEKLARDLNARWRQQTVVREALASADVISDMAGEAAKADKKGGLSVGLAAPVTRLGRIMGSRADSMRAKEGPKTDAETEAVKAMGKRLQNHEELTTQFARMTMEWADTMRIVVGALYKWARSFARVIWMDPDEECSESFNAFLVLIGDQLVVACDELTARIQRAILPIIHSLTDTMVAPMRLLEAMRALELLRHNPSNFTLAPSESYAALRAQLFMELPTYVRLLDKGVAMCILKFAHIQQGFYRNIHSQWVGLWDLLNTNGDVNEGAGETFRAWWNRFVDVDEQLMELNVVRSREENFPLNQQRMKLVSGNSYLDFGFVHLEESFELLEGSHQLSASFLRSFPTILADIRTAGLGKRDEELVGTGDFTRSIVEYLERLATIQGAAGRALLSIGDGNWKMGADTPVGKRRADEVDEKTLLEHFTYDVVSAVIEKLRARSRTHKHGSSHGAIFLFNNISYFRTQLLAEGSGVTAIVARPTRDVLDSSFRIAKAGYFDANLSPLLRTLMYERDGMSKSVIKERFHRFFVLLDELHARHQSARVLEEDPNGRAVVAEEAMKLVIPSLRRLIQRSLPQFSKNPQKYIKMTPEDVESVIKSFYV